MKGLATEVNDKKMPSKSALVEAFLEDHKHLTRGFREIQQALENGDVETAARIADQVDRLAGPHIEFEEEFFYPVVEKSRGHQYVARLYRDHGAGLDAVRTLIRGKAGELPPPERQRLLNETQTALDHAVSCGTLLSHVTVLSEEEQETLLAKLLELRARGRRWTDMAHNP